MREQNENDIAALPEYKARSNLSNFLGVKAGGITASGALHSVVPPSPPPSGYEHVLTPSQMLLSLDAAMATFHLHVESRMPLSAARGSTR